MSNDAQQFKDGTEADDGATTAADDDDPESISDDEGSPTTNLLRSYLKNLRWADLYDFAFDDDHRDVVVGVFDFKREVPGRNCLTGSPELAVMSLRSLSRRCPFCIPCILPFLLRECWRVKTERSRGQKLANCRHLAATVEGILYVEDGTTLGGTPYSPRRVFVPFRSMVCICHFEGEDDRVTIHYSEEGGGEHSQRCAVPNSLSRSMECVWIERLQKPRNVVELVELAFGDDRTIRRGEGYTIVFRRSRTTAANEEKKSEPSEAVTGLV